eukprot:TRINITY_DN5655_c0_g1_i1.p1 TRINITY_DN5655_c0_g1~~TRINITY_DN5655_c0_g1_i1.p1  ORF type:complete len:332 (+),score=52.88 TRINITY_DN5655_c0_g1_i1:174-1169(+)
MSALETKASHLGISLQVASPLDIGSLNGLQLGLNGEHQYQNAGLAVALCRTWLQKTGHIEGMYLDETGSLPEQFAKGLATANLQGRAQIVPDLHINMQSQSQSTKANPSLGKLVYYLDGAHSPESMEICARWFCHAVAEDLQQQKPLEKQPHDNWSATHSLLQNYPNECNKLESFGKSSTQILLFNCMPVRDPQLLLPCLINACARYGIHFHKAIFVPSQSVFNKVGSHALPSSDPPQVDLSWQLTLQKVWENLIHGDKGGGISKTLDCEGKKGAEPSNIRSFESSRVFPSLPLAIRWLRDNVQQNRSVHFQVLVTGSLHLVGDVLRLIKK